jgi:hypothetical protein
MARQIARKFKDLQETVNERLGDCLCRLFDHPQSERWAPSPLLRRLAEAGTPLREAKAERFR